MIILYIFSYVCMYLFCMIVCCMITFFLYNACLIVMFVCDIDILITSISSFACFNIVILLVVWLSCSPWHVYSHFCISHSYWHDWFSILCIILFISTYCLFLLYTYFVYPVSCLVVCRYGWHTCSLFDYLFFVWLPVLCLTTCCMTTLLLCDACVVCPCGHTSILFTSKSLVSVDFVSLDLVFDMRLVTLLVSLTELVIRSIWYRCLKALWRRWTY